MAAALAADGIDVGGQRRLETETGVAMIIVDDQGENQLVALPGADEEVSAPAARPDVDVWVTQGEIPVRVVEGVLAAAPATGRSQSSRRRPRAGCRQN